jgi:hypothetical protein
MIIIVDSYSQFNEGNLNEHINEHENVNFVNKVIWFELQEFGEKWLRPHIGFVNQAVFIVCFISEEKWATRKE